MRILIICGAGIVSGKEIMTLELARGLQSSDLDVQILTSVWSSAAFPERLREAGLPFQKLPLGYISATLTWQCMNWTYGQIERLPELLLGYMSLLQTLQPDKVIHTNWHHLLLLLPLLNPHRDLYWVHEVFPNKRQYRALFRALNRRLQCFVPVSHAVGESLQHLGVPEQKIRVIHNGISDPSQGVELPEILNKTVRLGIVGQVNRWKGHDDLLEAFGAVSNQWPNTELHIFGQGAEDYEQQLRRRSREWGIDNQVKWHGFVDNRAAIFQNLDICVVPSRSEDPLPTVAIEASSFGLPVIGTQRGGLPEIIENGITGIIVSAENPNELSEGIKQLLVDPELRLAMGRKARQRMLSHFSRERFIKEFLPLLGVQPKTYWSA